MNEQTPRQPLFNPNEHLIQIKGRNGAADYLPVQWRLVWFRSLCPDGTIETEIVHLDLDRETEEEAFQWNNETRRSEKIVKRAPGFAVFRATVKDGKGGMAIGTKSEKAASFGDFIEKAETGAIGRALAALGYGTQFAGDEFDERHRIVDAPVENGREQRVASTVGANGNGRTRLASNGHQRQTEETSDPSGQREERASSSSARGKDLPDPQGPVTEQQWTSIRKLCQHLGKAEPQATDTMNYLAAKELIAQLSQEYRQNHNKAS